MGNYDEMSTARLTWVVLDRLVPSDEVAEARAALIARDPELQSLVAQGVMSDTEAIAALRSRQTRYGGQVPANGGAAWAKRVAMVAGTTIMTSVVLHLVR
ncbi:MAG: hypothetical protein QOD57_2550 [Actinomycetota bacterium]|nr:hypothetical protein [Actinomycetota bacterium]MDQ1504823.1 hypothetical protein [Actinomycetota bacterium]